MLLQHRPPDLAEAFLPDLPNMQSGENQVFFAKRWRTGLSGKPLCRRDGS